jgi:hypothetical protein
MVNKNNDDNRKLSWWGIGVGIINPLAKFNSLSVLILPIKSLIRYPKVQRRVSAHFEKSFKKRRDR